MNHDPRQLTDIYNVQRWSGGIRSLVIGIGIPNCGPSQFTITIAPVQSDEMEDKLKRRVRTLVKRGEISIENDGELFKPQELF